uniref:IRG-type G domain-containing protein n=1 Tax=Castor canadensis TaxID=51338 RepID=A0A8C0XKF7_CASCN
MGQELSDESNGEEHQDWDSRFATYFKNLRLGNKIISQETIHSIKLLLTKGNIQEVISAINDALQEIVDTPINIAVTGLSGAGKSSFINTLRGVGHEEEDAAPTGVLPMTMHRTPYTHPQIPSVVLWDLPGIGTTNLHAKDYFKKVKFNEYDFFIIISSTRVTQHDLDLAKEIRNMKKDFYFVRTKVDNALKYEETCKPITFQREKVLHQIRYCCIDALKQNNIDEPQIFLVSNKNSSEYDFPMLNDILSKELLAQKNNFMLSLLNIAEAAIERKQESLKHLIRLEALKVELLPHLHNIIKESDVEKLKESLHEYQVIFGVDDASLQSLAKDWHVSVEQIKENVKSMICSDNGNLLAMNLYITNIFCLQIYFLDTVTDDAKHLPHPPSQPSYLTPIPLHHPFSIFTAYFKNLKIGNKIISQEIIHSIKLQLTKGNIQGVNSAINDALQEIDNTPFNVAVIGLSGAGKSCFINALRRVEPEEKDAAPFGVLEITKHRMPCKHPKNSKVILWELPAMETTNLHANDYLEKVKFNDYDFFIIISGTRFTQHDLDLAKEIRKMKKDFYYVKTKVDSDLKNEEKIHPTAFEKEKFLQQIRYHFAQSFKQNNIDEPQIFLISNNNLSEYDLQILNNVLSKELPAQKHNNFMLSLLNIAEAAIERKRESLKHLIRLEALKVTLLPYTPNVLEKSDVEKLKESLYEYQDIFGVDDASLQNLAKDWQIPMEQLKEIIKSPSLLKTKKEETIQEKLWEYWQMVCSDNGNLLTMNFYIRIIFCLQIYFLDTVTNDAKVLLKEIYSRKSSILSHLANLKLPLPASCF